MALVKGLHLLASYRLEILIITIVVRSNIEKFITPAVLYAQALNYKNLEEQRREDYIYAKQNYKGMHRGRRYIPSFR